MKATRLAVGALTLATLLGCGGMFGGSAGDAGSGGGGGRGGLIVSQAELTALAQSVEVASLAHLTSRSEQVQAEIAAMNASPATLRDAEYFPETDVVSCTLRGGVPYSYIHNRPVTAPRRPYPRPLASDEVPMSKKVYLVNALGNAFYDDRNTYRSWLTSAGFQVVMGAGQVDELKTIVNDAGVLYYGGHGCQYHARVNLPNTSYGFSTRTEVTQANLLSYQTDINNGSLGISTVGMDDDPNPRDKNGNGRIDEDEKLIKRQVYVILPNFVETYFRFSVGSVAILDCCDSLMPVMMNAFGKAAVGCDTYIGWDKPVADTGITILRALDFLIGENQIAPNFDPDRRPFQVDKVFQYLKDNRLDKSTNSPALLEHRVVGRGDFGLFRPVIKKISVREANAPGVKDKIEIEGVFGRKSPNIPVEVTVDGKPLTVAEDARPDRLVCEIPRRGVGSAGPCVVTINGRKSLKVPITEWIIPMVYNFDGPGGCFYKIDLSLRLRADVHRVRELPGDTPKGWTVPATFSRGDTFATYAAGGTDGNETWSGSGSMKSLQEGTPPDIVAFQATLDTQVAKWLSVLMISGGGQVHVRYSNGAQTGFPPALAVNQFDLIYDPNTFEVVNGAVPGPVTARGQGTLTWSNVVPNFPPTQLTTR